MFESEEALFTLGSLSTKPMNLDELRDHAQIEGRQPWSDLDLGKVLHGLHYLRLSSLIDYERDAGGRGRVFHITEAGRQQLSKWLLHGSLVKRPEYFHFDLVVNALRGLSQEERCKVISRRRSVVESAQKRAKALLKDQTSMSLVHHAILEHHLMLLPVELEWLDGLVKEMGGWDESPDAIHWEDTET